MATKIEQITQVLAEMKVLAKGDATALAIVKDKEQQLAATLEDFHKQKKVDPSLKLEDIDIDSDHVPILLRDHDGNLYFHELGLSKFDFVDDAKSIGDGKMTVIREYYSDIILFTTKGNPIFAKRRISYEELTVKEGEDGKPDYNKANPADIIERKLVSTRETKELKKKEVIEGGVAVERDYYEIKTTKIYTKLYEEGERLNKKENCIAHTVTTSEEDLWINPVAISETIGINIPNVERMIKDGGFELISGNEGSANAGDLIVFKASADFIKDRKALQKVETQPGDYIHAAIYNGDKTYSTKNGELILNNKDTLTHLVQLYGNNYEFYKIPKDLNPKTNGTILGHIAKLKDKDYNKVFFRGREVLTIEDVKGLSEKEVIEKASKEIKALLKFDKEVPIFVDKIMSSLMNAKITKPQKESNVYSEEESLQIIEIIQKSLDAAIQN